MESLIKKLSDLRGISGFENRIGADIEKIMSEYCDEISIDTLGNVIGIVRSGKENAKKVMIEAHADEIGLMVTGIDEHGFLSFTNVGGVDGRILPGCEVTVHASVDLYGVIGAKPPHLQTADEADKSIKLKDMAIDVGLDFKAASELISVGDSITLSQSCGKLLGNMYSGKCLDDRAGAAAVIKTLQNLKKMKPEVDVYAVIAVQEEVGLRGAKTAAYSINPDAAIAVDVCHAVTYDNSKDAYEAGEGVIVSVGPNIHPKLSKKLFELADRYNIKTDIDADGGATGTDAWSIQVVRSGIPTGLLSIPLKYMHTNVEVLNIDDVVATADLLTHFVMECDDKMEEWLCF